MNKKPMIILTGPTAVGKTSLSIALAKQIGGEIISADSMQVYRYMDIGTAKITTEEMDGIPHYLVDCLDPDEEFNIYIFQQMAKQALDTIYAHHHIPILVGGTGFYIQSVLYDIEFEKEENTGNAALRIHYEKCLKEKGAEYLHQKLAQVDEASAQAIHPNNTKRVIRALEFFEINHYPISMHNEQEHHKESPYNFCYFVLTDQRKTLYQRIEDRVDDMIEQGLLQEVIRLKEMGYPRSLVSMQGIGYKELYRYLDDEISLEEAIHQIKLDTRHFAKRQLTWFRRERQVCWLDKSELGNDNSVLLKKMEQEYSAKGI